MSDVLLLTVRGLAGGTIVVAFALIGEVLSPKAFAGLFSAAPSVAVASLALTIVAESATMARQDAVGMVVGGIGMSACCVLAALSIPRVKALWGSFAAWMTWMAIGLGLYWAVFVGAR